MKSIREIICGVPRHWVGNQGRTFPQERAGGFIRAAKQNEKGTEFFSLHE